MGSNSLDSTQIGTTNTVTGQNSLAVGQNNNVSANNSVAIGDTNTVAGQNNLASGTGHNIDAQRSTALGKEHIVKGDTNTAIGCNNNVDGNCNMTEGEVNTIPPTVVDVTSPDKTLISSGCHAEGCFGTVGGICCHMEGDGNLVTGYNMSASGLSNQSRGSNTTVFGANNFSIGFQNIAEGWDVANGKINSTTGGLDLPTAGIHILGDSGLARAGIISPNFLEDTDMYSLQLAGGLFSPALNTQDPKTAYGVGISAIIKTRIRGLHPEGEVIAQRHTADGSSYAEYFKWFDCNFRRKDRVGLFVMLDTDPCHADRIFPAKCTCSVIGVTTEVPAVTGDSAELGWAGLIEKDAFGRSETEPSFRASLCRFLHTLSPTEQKELQRIKDECDATSDNEQYRSCILNSLVSSSLSGDTRQAIVNLAEMSITKPKNGVDHTTPYVPRSIDPAWSPVSLIGKVIVRDDGTCIPGRKCIVGRKGRATFSKKKYKGWPVLKRISKKTVVILFK